MVAVEGAAEEKLLEKARTFYGQSAIDEHVFVAEQEKMLDKS